MNRRRKNSFDEEEHDALKMETEKGFLMCHQCQHRFESDIVICSNCQMMHYCYACLANWYPERSHEEVRAACPVCSGYCSCKTCMQTMLTVSQKHGNKNIKLQRLVYLLHKILPLIRKIHSEQNLEMEIEAKIHRVQPTEVDVARTTLAIDEHLFCDNCATSVLDFYRSCPSCSYNICLGCCHQLREDTQFCHCETDLASEYCDDQDALTPSNKQFSCRTHAESGNDYFAEANSFLPHWKANKDGSIPCPPKERGGCGNGLLLLKCTFNVNWLVKLLENIEELARDFPFLCEEDLAQNCILCSPCDFSQLRRASFRDNGHSNFLYCPKAIDLSDDDIDHFQSHWLRGEPAIVRGVFDKTGSLSWEPMILWRAAQETKVTKSNDESKTIKAIDCFDWHEVDINVHQFFRGYLEGRMHETGWPEMLILNEFPFFSSLEECLPQHYAEFTEVLPFSDYTHPRDGVLNLAKKLPDGCLRPNLDPKTYIAYGFQDELGRGDSVMKLHYDKSDVVNLLVHTHQVKIHPWQHDIIKSMQIQNKDKDLCAHFGGIEVSMEEPTRTQQVIVSTLCETVEGSTNEVNIKYKTVLSKEDILVLSESEVQLPDRQTQYGIAEKVRSDTLDTSVFSMSIFSPTEMDAASATCSATENLCATDATHEKSSAYQLHTEAKLSNEVVLDHDGLNSNTTFDNHFGDLAKGKNDYDFMNVDRGYAKEKAGCRDEIINNDYEDSRKKGKHVLHQETLLDASFYDKSIPMVGRGGAVWDIFRRQDVSKLMEYLQKHRKDFQHTDNLSICSVVHPIHDQAVFLSDQHKKQLKEEYGIEPWTFEQYLGEAVFVPAGCPYQVRNRQSCTKVALGFVSPENINECIQLMTEFSCLPKSNLAKEDKWEVKKMALYAAYAAMKEAEDILADLT